MTTYDAKGVTFTIPPGVYTGENIATQFNRDVRLYEAGLHGIKWDADMMEWIADGSPDTMDYVRRIPKTYQAVIERMRNHLHRASAARIAYAMHQVVEQRERILPTAFLQELDEIK